MFTAGVTGTGATGSALTVTVHVADLPLPSLAVQVIVVLPSDTAVILPLASTFATVALEDFHSTALLVAVKGDTVAVNVFVLPTVIVSLVELIVTLVTDIVFEATVTSHSAYFSLPSVAAAFIVAFPAFLAIIFPVLSTETISE